MRISVYPLTAADTCRLIPSRYPSTGILDVVGEPNDLAAVIELESWTNDRVSAELGVLFRLPREEWVSGRPMSSVVMAPFCHPALQGGRFNSPHRGAWYAGLALQTAQREVIYHRSRDLQEVGVERTILQMRLYLADFFNEFHDLRPEAEAFEKYRDPLNYKASQRLAATLTKKGSNGIIYRSLRDSTGICVACFRPASVRNVRIGGHYELRWVSGEEPVMHRLRSPRPHR